MKTIASFTVDHDFIIPGIYISRIDGDVVTYDLRTRIPNAGDYMDNLTMHSVEHMLATLLRNSEIAAQVVYFGPMGCQTGFYLLVRAEIDKNTVLNELKKALQGVLDYDGPVYGAARKACGNWQNLSLEAAKAECARYLAALNAREWDFTYPQGENK